MACQHENRTIKKVSRRHLLEQESWWCSGYDVLRAEKKSPSVLFFLKSEKPSQPRQQPLICFLFPGMRFINHFLLLALDGSQWVASCLGGEHLPGDAEWGQTCAHAPRPAQQGKPLCGPAWCTCSGLQPAWSARALWEQALSRNAPGNRLAVCGVINISVSQPRPAGCSPHLCPRPATGSQPKCDSVGAGGAVSEATGAACITPSQGPAWAPVQPGDPSSHQSCATILTVNLEARVLVAADRSSSPGLVPLCTSRAQVGLMILAVCEFPFVF